MRKIAFIFLWPLAIPVGIALCIYTFIVMLIFLMPAMVANILGQDEVCDWLDDLFPKFAPWMDY